MWTPYTVAFSKIRWHQSCHPVTVFYPLLRLTLLSLPYNVCVFCLYSTQEYSTSQPRAIDVYCSYVNHARAMSNYIYQRLLDPTDLAASVHVKKLELPPRQDEYSPYVATQVHATIRLLIVKPGKVEDLIESDLLQVNLHDLPKYEALSYRWGDQTQTQTIKCHGCNMKITSSLHTTLVSLRHTDAPRVLWIDAVCIDQTNLEEKQQQVLLMDSIFLHSHRVLIWLGTESNEDRRAIVLVERLYPILSEIEAQHMYGTKRYGSATRDSEMRSALSEGTSSAEDLRHLFRLLDRPWFHRIWTVTEFAKASDPVIIYHNQEIPAQWLTFVILRIYWHMKFVSELLEIDEATQSKLELRLLNCISVHSLRFSGAAGQKEPSMGALLAMTRSRESTDPKDRLYALLSLASPLERGIIQPDYYPTLTYHDVLKKFFISTFVTLKTLKYLMPSFPECNDQQSLHSPSWFADPCLPTNGGSLQLDDQLYKAAGDTNASIDFSNDILSVAGKVVDVIDQTSAECLYNPPGESKDVYKSATLRRWLEESHDLAFGNVDADTDLSKTTVRAASYARTLILECQPSWRILLTPEEIVGFYETLQRLLASFKTDGELAQSKDLLSDKELEMVSGLGKCLRRKFCTTGNQRFAAAPRAVQKGDVVCILYGHGIPQILRGASHGHYRLIGGCYLDGLMHGEAMEPGLFEDQVFNLT